MIAVEVDWRFPGGIGDQVRRAATADRRSGRRLPLLLLLSLLTVPTAGFGQGSFVTLQFSFSNPGARSLGFGGAFVAIADDATAAFANPAGLVQILEPEVSLEGRAWSYEIPYTLGGRIDGEPSGHGLDVLPGLRFDESNRDVSGLSFLSFVYPRKRWSLAVYRHQLADYEFRSESQGLFALPNLPARPGAVGRRFDVRAANDLEIVSYGVAGGWRVSDALSLGLGLVYFDIGLSGVEQSFLFDSPERFFAENSYLPAREVSRLVFSADDRDWGLAGGFLWRRSPRWSLGGFYRQGPDVELAGAALAGPALGSVPPGTVLDGETSPMDLPDAFGLGLSYRSAGGRLTLALEWDRVEYGDILESVTFDVEQRIDDGDELRAGGEFVLLDHRPTIALRMGAWIDPDHRLRADGGDSLNRAIFRAGDDELHYAFGIGVVFRTFQIDLAVDLSDAIETIALSTVYGL